MDGLAEACLDPGQKLLSDYIIKIGVISHVLLQFTPIEEVHITACSFINFIKDHMLAPFICRAGIWSMLYGIHALIHNAVGKLRVSFILPPGVYLVRIKLSMTSGFAVAAQSLTP